jgi:signal transduction histidine kinase
MEPTSAAPVEVRDAPTVAARSRRRLTSRQRLTIQLVVGLAVLFGVFGIVTVTLARRALEGRLDRELTATAVSTADTLELLPTEGYAELASRPAVGDQAYTFVLFAPDGTETRVGVGLGVDPSVLVDVGPADAARLRGQSGKPFTIANPAGTAGRFRVVSAALDNGYVVVVARSLDEVRDSLTVIASVLLGGFVVLLAALCLLVWFVGRQALKPLEDVIASTDSIGYDNLAARVTAASSARDVEHLTGAVNGMLSRIEASVAGKEDADRRLRQFVADASHELRTPLAAVLGYTELFETGVATRPDQVDKAMRRIAVEGARMQRLVEDLLTLARLDEGRLQRPSPVGLDQVVVEAIAAAQAADQQRTFTLDETGPQPVAFVDRDAIRQVLDNLLANVRNHTPAGTTATISLRSAGDFAVVVIADDGPGMTAADRQRAFDRFWRADAARARPGGSGLGLAIVHGLVVANRGEIGLDTSPSGGLLTEIRLPLARRSPSPDARNQQGEPPRLPARGT